jgi:hypothetical protein
MAFFVWPTPTAYEGDPPPPLQDWTEENSYMYTQQVSVLL